MKAAVTGGAGFIGKHITGKLIERDDVSEVVVLDNLSVGDKNDVAKEATFNWCDIKNKDSLRQFLKDVDIVFHNAAFVSIRGSFGLIRHDIEVNDIGTLNLLEVARDLNVSKVIMASSMAVYGKPCSLPVKESDYTMPISPYGFSKLKGEYYCNLFRERYGLKTVILRYFNTYGIGQTLSDYVGVVSIFVNQALNGESLTIFGDGTQSRDFVHVEDVAEANICAAFSDVEGAFNIASGKEITVNDIATWIMEETGSQRKIFLEPPPGEIKRMVADISKAKKQLGFEPKGNFRNVLPEIIEFWKARKEGLYV